MIHDPPTLARPWKFAWTFGLHFGARRRVGHRIGIIPFGDVGRLRRITSVDWIGLDPGQPVLAGLCDVLVADFSARLPAEWEAQLAEAAIGGRMVFPVKQLAEALTGRVAIDSLDEIGFGTCIGTRPYLHVKSLVDGLLALAVLPAALPLMALLAMAIRIDSPGPVLFRQPRVGLAGRRFTMWKFRTMADLPWEDALGDDGNWRMTRLGAFLRRTRLDELPQIFNVIAGDMSWIGPRPEAEILSRWYMGEIPFYRYRHVVRPGISGWAQVNQGHVVGVEEVHAKLQFDFYYIKYFSAWLDLLIALRTVKTMISGFGAK
jgi:lipopolysaccharide/colanic/teichoic acid biosynthesis glycosyltransferase